MNFDMQILKGLDSNVLKWKVAHWVEVTFSPFPLNRHPTGLCTWAETLWVRVESRELPQQPQCGPGWLWPAGPRAFSDQTGTAVEQPGYGGLGCRHCESDAHRHDKLHLLRYDWVTDSWHWKWRQKACIGWGTCSVKQWILDSFARFLCDSE